MPLTDPIGDFVTRMRNAQHGRRSECSAPWSRLKESIAKLLKEHKFIQDFRVEGETASKNLIVAFRADRPALELKRISTPGARKYVGATDIRKHLHGATIAIISTSSGLVTSKDARKQNIGGEILCTVS